MTATFFISGAFLGRSSSRGIPNDHRVFQGFPEVFQMCSRAFQGRSRIWKLLGVPEILHEISEAFLGFVELKGRSRRVQRVAKSSRVLYVFWVF